MKKVFFLLLAMLSTMSFISCSKDDAVASNQKDEIPEGPAWEWVDPKTGVSDSLLNELANASITLGTLFTITPEEYTVADVDDYWKMLSTLSDYIQKADIETRGIFSQGVCYVQFVQALASAAKTHRVVVMGVLSELGYTSSDVLRSIFEDIKKHVGDKSASPFQYDAMYFWKQFSLGKYDDYAIAIHHALIACNLGGYASTPAEKVGEYLVDNGLREIDMAMSIAPKLLDAGVNLVFSTTNDLISYGKLAFDIVDANGTLAIEMSKGNLSAETLSNAAATNLKALAKALEEIVPWSQDIFEFVVDATAEQAMEFNKELQLILNEYEDAIPIEAMELFKKNVEKIFFTRHNLDNSIWYKDDLMITFGVDQLERKFPHKAYLYIKLPTSSDYQLVAMMDYVEFETYVDFTKIWIYPTNLDKSGARSKDQTININIPDYKTLKIKGNLGYGNRARDLSGTWSIERPVLTDLSLVGEWDYWTNFNSDGTGIAHTLRFNADGTYIDYYYHDLKAAGSDNRTYTYTNRDFYIRDKGKYSVKGSIITLKNDDPDSKYQWFGFIDHDLEFSIEQVVNPVVDKIEYNYTGPQLTITTTPDSKDKGKAVLYKDLIQKKLIAEELGKLSYISFKFGGRYHHVRQDPFLDDVDEEQAYEPTEIGFYAEDLKMTKADGVYHYELSSGKENAKNKTFILELAEKVDKDGIGQWYVKKLEYNHEYENVEDNKSYHTVETYKERMEGYDIPYTTGGNDYYLRFRGMASDGFIGSYMRHSKVISTNKKNNTTTTSFNYYDSFEGRNYYLDVNMSYKKE